MQTHERTVDMQIAAWMREAGMYSGTDEVANVHGRINGLNATAPALVLGSHYDTVKDAGKFDGALGILVGVAAIKASVIEVIFNDRTYIFLHTSFVALLGIHAFQTCRVPSSTELAC